MIEAVLFDFDGTLMNTDEVVLRSWQHTYEGMGMPVPSDDYIRTTFGEPLIRSMQEEFPDADYKIPLGIYRTFNESRFLEYAKPYPGMVELIDRLREKGILTALVTSRLKRTTYIGLEHFDLVRRFDAILTEDESPSSKPDPGPVYVTLRMLGMDFKESPTGALAPDGTSLKDRVLMIGDSIYDIRCCDNAGIGSMLVTWTQALKITQEGDMNTAVHGNGEEVHPDFILPDADDFEKILAGRM